MREYNKLTQELLAEGYTAENHPSWVRVGSSCYEYGNPLRNLDGGFVYNWKELPDINFQTPCGMHVKRESAMNGMSWHGIDWSFENDMAIIHCPFGRIGCEMNHPILRNEKNMAGTVWCRIEKTDEAYREYRSYEYFKKVADDWKRELMQDLIRERKGHYCLLHMRYFPFEERWELQKYDPDICANIGCMGNCQYLGIPLDKKKGNVFYDLRITQTDPQERGTLFEGTRHTCILKGNKAFKKPVSMTICENYAKLCKKELTRHVLGEWHSEIFFAKFRGDVFEVSVENIRAERKETRDLRQDLQDIREGIKISHVSDDEKQKKRQKQARAAERKEKKKKRLRKMMLEGRELSYVESRQVEKLFADDEIDEIMSERDKVTNKEPEPEQMSIFDFLS